MTTLSDQFADKSSASQTIPHRPSVSRSPDASITPGVPLVTLPPPAKHGVLTLIPDRLEGTINLNNAGDGLSGLIIQAHLSALP
jgi:hypothetical protein